MSVVDLPRLVQPISSLILIAISTTAANAQESIVPPAPPDSISVTITRVSYADSNLVTVPGLSGRFPRDIIWVTFQDDTPQSVRQQTIDLIRGIVVGGIPLTPGGIYVLRIRHDGTGQSVADAIAALDTLPQIRLVTPDLNNELSPTSP